MLQFVDSNYGLLSQRFLTIEEDVIHEFKDMTDVIEL